MTAEAELLDYLARFAYRYSPEKPFLLASGAESYEYLDCKVALSRPEAIAALGKVFCARLTPGVVAIGGLTMGADPIAISTSNASLATKSPVCWFTVRKQPKAHGQKKLIEGSASPGDRVVVVDDVVTKGDSTIKAIQACRDFGLEIAQVLVLVDREEQDGIARVRSAAGSDVEVSAIFTKSEIKKRWAQLHQTQVTYHATA